MGDVKHIPTETYNAYDTYIKTLLYTYVHVVISAHLNELNLLGTSTHNPTHSRCSLAE